MEPAIPADATALTAMNVILGLLCAAMLLGVAGGALWELRERRRLRLSLPDCWPPEPEKTSAPPPAARRSGGRVHGAARA